MAAVLLGISSTDLQTYVFSSVRPCHLNASPEGCPECSADHMALQNQYQWLKAGLWEWGCSRGHILRAGTPPYVTGIQSSLETTGILVTAHKSSSVLYFDWRHISKVFFKEKKAKCKKAIYTIYIAYFLRWISPGHQEETGRSHALDLYGDKWSVIVMILLSGLHRMKAQNGLCYFQDLAFWELTYSFKLFIVNNEEQILPCEIWCFPICIKRLFLGGIFYFKNKLF